MSWPLYHYRAFGIRVVDGDTVDVDLDLGCFIRRKVRCRMLGIDTPELHDPDSDKRAEAVRAAEVLTSYVIDKWVYVKTDLDKDDKYGRLLITIYITGEDGEKSLNRSMVEWGLAVPYIGWERV